MMVEAKKRDLGALGTGGKVVKPPVQNQDDLRPGWNFMREDLRPGCVGKCRQSGEGAAHLWRKTWEKTAGQLQVTL